MAIADSKKCQTLINKAAEAAEQIQQAVAMLKTLRTKFQQHNPDTTGTPLEGNVAAISNWIDDVDNISTNIVATQMIEAKVLTHQGNALEI